MTNEKEYTRMNILFFITPKSETAYLYDDCSLRQAIEKIEYHKYTAVPVLNKKGCYVGTLTEGDLLRIIKERYLLNYHEAEDIPLWQVPKRWNYESVNINSNIEDLIEMSMRQNFVPVVDDEGIFIGIIRRRDIIQYCYQKSGITMVFIPALTTFVISDLLGGSKILLIGNVIEQEFKQTNNWNAGSALSTVLMIFIILSMVLMNKYDKDGEGTAF